jgi:beta-phosphoglucomutase
MIKAALFDLDGVVFNTEPLYTKFWGEQFQHYFPNKPGLEQAIKGQTLVQIYDHYFHGQQSVQDTITQRLNDFEANMTYEYIPGFKDFMKQLKNHQVRSAIVTSSNNAKMESVYRNHPEFADMFDAILTSEDFERSKPDPDCYLKAAKRLDMEPKDCVGFEDSFNGLKSLRAANIYTVGLATTNDAEAIENLSDEVVPNFKAPQLSNLFK